MNCFNSLIFSDMNDENEFEDLDDQIQDAKPKPIRLRKIFRSRKLKCIGKCVAYYACMAKSSGLARYLCRRIAKNCRCKPGK